MFFAQTQLSSLISHVNVRRRSSPSLTRNVMLALLAVMYGISASHCAINVANSVRAISLGRFARTPVTQLMAFYLPTVNVRPCPFQTLTRKDVIADRPRKYVLSDGIVLWRAWVLWNREFLLFIPALIALICSFGGRHRNLTRSCPSEMTPLFSSNLRRCSRILLQRRRGALSPPHNDEPLLCMVHLWFLCQHESLGYWPNLHSNMVRCRLFDLALTWSC